MTEHDPIDVDRLSDDQLAAALQAGIVGSDWPEQAAVDLLVQHRRWLCRFELRQAVEAAVIDGELCAWVAWPYVDLDAPASSGELRILDHRPLLGRRGLGPQHRRPIDQPGRDQHGPGAASHFDRLPRSRHRSRCGMVEGREGAS